MTVEEKLKEKSIRSYGWDNDKQDYIPLIEVIKLSDAIAICKEVLKKQRELIAENEGLDCPNITNCNNGGTLSEHGCNGTEEDCWNTCPVPVQCEFCYCQRGSKYRISHSPEPELD